MSQNYGDPASLTTALGQLPDSLFSNAMLKCSSPTLFLNCKITKNTPNKNI